MEYFTADFLARVQFAFTISFHIVFPSISIGLAAFLAYIQFMANKTSKERYQATFDYWRPIFAVIFGMGVVSGIVMSYQIGTNWSLFSQKTGAIIGPLMGYEVLTAFFLEAGFLGVMLFGREKVGKKLHMFATFMVAIGVAISAFWILSVNSWMQTPSGYGIDENGNFYPKDWFAIVFNPSFPYRLLHMLTAAYLTSSFVIAGVSAYHLIKDNKNIVARQSLSIVMWSILILAPLQAYLGDLHGLNTLEHQPLKVAAMEGNFETRNGAPLILFGIINMEEKRVDYAIKIPKLASYVLTHDKNGELKGLDIAPEEDWPVVSVVFYSFRVMVGIGMLMILISIIALWKRRKGTLFKTKWLHKILVVMGGSGIVATLAGWFVTETGRQPWTVYGLLRRSDSLSPVAVEAVAFSLLIFVIIYIFVFGMGVYYLFTKFKTLPKYPLKYKAVDNEYPIAGINMTPNQKGKI
jgi:cytochrome d ubiquinol oxidase subunit I